MSMPRYATVSFSLLLGLCHGATDRFGHEPESPAASAPTLSADLLRNGSFENGIWYSRFRGWSPSGWYQWFTRGGHVPEHAVGKRLPHSGREYVRLHMWAHAWCGGILQNVTGVEPCHMYRLRAYGFFQPSSAPDTGARIGIDPTGTLAKQFSVDVSAHPAPKYDEGVGDDPGTRTVDGPGFPAATCWSDAHDYYRWGVFEVIAEARSGTITAILSCSPVQRPADSPIYEMNWDSVSLREIPWPTRRLVAEDTVLVPSTDMTKVDVTLPQGQATAQVTWRTRNPAGASQVLYGFSREDSAGLHLTSGALRSRDLPLETPVVYERSSRYHRVAVAMPAQGSASHLQIVALSRVLVDGTCVTQATPPVSLRLARTIPITSAGQAANWQDNINQGGTMTRHRHSPHGVRFEMQFADSDPWCYPTLRLDATEIPDQSFRGLSLTVHLIQGEGTVRVQFLETQGTQYVAETGYRSDQHTAQRVLASFRGAQSRPTSPRDPNGRLDPAAVRWIMVGMNSKPHSRVSLVVSDLEWIK